MPGPTPSSEASGARCPLRPSLGESHLLNVSDLQLVRIRLTRVGDAVAVARVYHQGWHAAHAAVLPWLTVERPPEAFTAKVPGMLEHCLVAEVCGTEVVGFAAWNVAELGQLFIEPSWLGTGLGAVLLAGAEKAMRESGVQEAWLTCVVGNDRARAFYLRHGWTSRGVEDYPARTKDGQVPVAVWRLTKRL